MPTVLSCDTPWTFVSRAGQGEAASHAAGGSIENWPSHDDVVALLPTDLRTTRLPTAATRG